MRRASVSPRLDVVGVTIDAENWTAAEELSLIEQVRKHGLGAWETLVESVSSRARLGAGAARLDPAGAALALTSPVRH